MATWPEVGDKVVIWLERPPSSTPREPREAVVDHVAGLTFTVEGLETTFNRSTGRSKPVRRSPGAFGTDTYVAVDAAGERAREVLGAAARSQGETRAVEAVRAWLIERSEPNRRVALEALTALDPHAEPRPGPQADG